MLSCPIYILNLLYLLIEFIWVNRKTSVIHFFNEGNCTWLIEMRWIWIPMVMPFIVFSLLSLWNNNCPLNEAWKDVGIWKYSWKGGFGILIDRNQKASPVHYLILEIKAGGFVLMIINITMGNNSSALAWNSISLISCRYKLKRKTLYRKILRTSIPYQRISKMILQAFRIHAILSRGARYLLILFNSILWCCIEHILWNSIDLRKLPAWAFGNKRWSVTTKAISRWYSLIHKQSDSFFRNASSFWASSVCFGENILFKKGRIWWRMLTKLYISSYLLYTLIVISFSMPSIAFSITSEEALLYIGLVTILSIIFYNSRLCV